MQVNKAKWSESGKVLTINGVDYIVNKIIQNGVLVNTEELQGYTTKLINWSDIV
jgi:hypothetical protein